MRAKTARVLTAVLLAGIGVGVFVELAMEGRWIYAAALGLLMPVSTAIEWRAARARSEAEGVVAQRLALIVAATLMLVGGMHGGTVERAANRVVAGD